MDSKKRHRKKRTLHVPPKKKRKVQYFDCYCTCCGHKWSTTTDLYKFEKGFCEECGSIYFETDNPNYPDTLEERLGQLELPVEI
jgi:hypothetical protein